MKFMSLRRISRLSTILRCQIELETRRLPCLPSDARPVSTGRLVLLFAGGRTNARPLVKKTRIRAGGELERSLLDRLT